jgi:CRISPR-associated nuclease/helicase Cas3-like protein
VSESFRSDQRPSDRATIPLGRFWAKTTTTGAPGISVRDHCLNVGYLAKALLQRLPATVRSLIPRGATTLAALHDVGKISPGFQRKCLAWRQQFEAAELERVWGQGETNHAAVSHALIGSWLGKSASGSPHRKSHPGSSATPEKVPFGLLFIIPSLPDGRLSHKFKRFSEAT